MPQKIRELKAQLRRAGFEQRAGKGSHSVWSHQKIAESLTLSGADGQDAKPYQQSQVAEFIRKVEDAS